MMRGNLCGTVIDPETGNGISKALLALKKITLTVEQIAADRSTTTEVNELLFADVTKDTMLTNNLIKTAVSAKDTYFIGQQLDFSADQYGWFEVNDLSQGQWQVSHLSTRVNIEIFDNSTTQVTVSSAPNTNSRSIKMGSIYGTVTDSSTGLTVANASITIVESPQSQADISALTDDHGRFNMVNLAVGTWILKAVTNDNKMGLVSIDVRQGSEARPTIKVR
jgi:Carboxypeptidase regulatory-like domain